MDEPSRQTAITHWTAPSVAQLRGSIPGFEFIRLIACGGMAAVYEARQQSLDRRVALKILPPALHDAPEMTALFESEARALGRLNHTGVVTVIDFGRTADGLHFIAMEFVEGVALDAWGVGRTAAEKQRTAVRLLEAVAACHDAGIVHADLKPGNVLVQADGGVKVMDFGIAGLVGAKPAPDAPRFGTPPYTAPEAYQQGAQPDPRSDVYSLGRMLLELFAAAAPTTPVEEAIERLSPALARLVTQMLAPANVRLSSAAQCAARLAELPLSTVSSCPPAPVGRTVPRRRDGATRATRRTAPRGALNMSILAVAALLVGWAFWHQSRPRAAAERPTPSVVAPADELAGPAAEPVVREGAGSGGNQASSAPSPPTVTGDTPTGGPGPLDAVEMFPDIPATPTAPEKEAAAPTRRDPVADTLVDKLLAHMNRREKEAATPDERAMWTTEIARLGGSRDVPATAPPGTPEALSKLWATFHAELQRAKTTPPTPDVGGASEEAGVAKPPVAPAVGSARVTPPASTKAPITLYWGASGWSSLYLNGKKIEPSHVEKGAELGKNIYRAELEVAAGDMVAIRITREWSEYRHFAAVAKVGSRTLFQTDTRWQVMDGRASDEWLAGGAGAIRSPRKVSSKERSDVWLKRFCAVTGASVGGLFVCWGEDPAQCSMRRAITQIDVNTALGR